MDGNPFKVILLSFIVIFVILLQAFSGVIAVSSKGTEATVYKQNGEFVIKLGVLDKEGLAYGVYNDTFQTTGWGVLNVKAGYSSKKYLENDVALAAGFLEGYLTSREIFQHTVNINATFFKGNSEFPIILKKFFQKQDAWTRSMIKAHEETDPYWRGISLILSQYDGLVKGYNANPYQNKSLEAFNFQILNGCGDIIDLKHALMPETFVDWKHMTKSQLTKFIAENGHCSALIKVLPALENFFMSHSSWFTYQSTLRIYKHYDINVSGLASTKMSFSSYPGFLESLDDFYHMSSGLTMLQTTNNVFNQSLYSAVVPESLLAWQRVRLANHLAYNGHTWGVILEKYNSGTYNNQYMVLDRSKLKPNKAILDNALWVVEQIPTLVVYKDETNVLRAGYWPSYNVPFFEEIYNMSGYPDVVAKHGPDMSYQLAPRAKIFRRDQGSVKDMDTMKTIMRYNEYTTDPYSEGDPVNAICARGDLRQEGASASGCYDTKVSDLAMADKMQSYAINGPTRFEGSLPPFSWTGQFANYSHVGLPDVYKFDFVTMQPMDLP
ncbi:Phospholipase B-like 1 [Holothuria leucospilota]|uniref:Phospholipase B-like n=1 Tax=Holothuria leucospilota TaxID=206669 RepID=A0A9Q1H8R9_HOLLE|nr:Phospholipase B-like 1 [Holothuria leucospilota]